MIRNYQICLIISCTTCLGSVAINDNNYTNSMSYSVADLMPLPTRNHPPLTQENAEIIKDYQLSQFQGIANFINMLYQKGIELNNGLDFDSGAFVIEDPGFQIFSALRTAVSTAAGKAENSRWMTTEQTNANTLAYPRKSSHINKIYFLRGDAQKDFLSGEAKSKKKEFVHYGIDFAEGQLETKEGSNKRHLLFGKIGKINGIDWLFLKPEDHGLGSSDFLSHSLGFIKSKLGIGETAGGVYRKERIPLDILQAFEDNLNGLQLTSREKKDVMTQASAYGIWFMMNFAKEHDWESFMSLILEKYPHDYCIRMGNEILITQHDVDCAS